MTTRERAPSGAPCWTDLWTSDVEASRAFYAGLFGWEAQEANPEFGGYFLFTRDGAPIAGAMGDMGDMKANDRWQIYLATDDADATAKAAEASGGQIISPPMAVADLGTQVILVDPTGANVGAWQPATFPGFVAWKEFGAPDWFELLTRDHAKAVEFYRSVFDWQTRTEADTDEFRYTVMIDPSGEGELAGIMDASAFLPEGVPGSWSVYWSVDDVATSVARVKELGGGVQRDTEETPYGTIATVTDPAGAPFKLRTPPKPA